MEILKPKVTKCQEYDLVKSIKENDFSNYIFTNVPLEKYEINDVIFNSCIFKDIDFTNIDFKSLNGLIIDKFQASELVGLLGVKLK